LDPLLPKQVRYQAALHADNQYSNRMHDPISPLPWLEPGELFPSVEKTWGPSSDAPGLLAVGGDLSMQTLQSAYSEGIFPWFSDGQPILWWSTDPRMALKVDQFRPRRSLRKVLIRFAESERCEIRFDTAFAQVIQSCATAPRRGHPGTWIVPEMVQAYTQLHAAGLAHSVETWVDGVLVGGLYCVALGKAVFGESMFTHQTDASKIALAALVAFCRVHGIALIDCQQNTDHLASLGAAEIPRDQFVAHVRQARTLATPTWHFDPLYWSSILSR
jgi:leucyl/phenylalanyl-tRNA---protein transferase